MNDLRKALLATQWPPSNVDMALKVAADCNPADLAMIGFAIAANAGSTGVTQDFRMPVLATDAETKEFTDGFERGFIEYRRRLQSVDDRRSLKRIGIKHSAGGTPLHRRRRPLSGRSPQTLR